MTVTVGEETYETIGEAALDNSTLLAAIKKELLSTRPKLIQDNF